MIYAAVLSKQFKKMKKHKRKLPFVFRFPIHLSRNCGIVFARQVMYEALPHGGGQTRFLKADEKLIREAVREQPDITLVELAEKVARETGKPAVSLMTMSVELRRLNLPRKKR